MTALFLVVSLTVICMLYMHKDESIDINLILDEKGEPMHWDENWDPIKEGGFKYTHHSGAKHDFEKRLYYIKKINKRARQMGMPRQLSPNDPFTLKDLKELWNEGKKLKSFIDFDLMNKQRQEAEKIRQQKMGSQVAASPVQ